MDFAMKKCHKLAASISTTIERGALFYLAVAGLLLAFEGTASAQPNRTWTGLGADSQWTTAENWDPVGVPHPNLGDTQYTLAGTTRLDPTIAQIYVINKITYDNTAGAFTLTNSSALWMGNGGFVNNSTSTQTVNSMVNLFASQTWNAAAGDMMFTDIEMLFGSAKLLTIDGAHNVTVTGDFSGQAGVRKQGTGTLLFSGTNTYTNGTTVDAGVLRVGSATGLPQNTNYTVNGGTLDLNNFDLTATQLDGTGGSIDLGTAALNVDQTSDTTFAGGITGTGSLNKLGSGNLSLTGANDYSGGTTVSAGTLTGTTAGLQGTIVNDANVVFDQSTNGTFAGSIIGNGAVAKEGSGTVSLSAVNTYVGTTSVNGGTLAVNGAITSNTTVGANGTLGGSGTIFGDVNNLGRLATGNSIGTLNVVGNYTAGANSTTQVEINAAGNSDLLSVTGTASVNGTVQVLGAPGTYVAGRQYVFLSAAGGITGAYNSITDDLAMFNAVLFNDVNQYGFELVPSYPTFYSLGQNTNQQNVGAYLDANISDPNFAGLAEEFLMLTNAQVANGLQQLAGEVYATSPQTMFQSTTLTMQNVMARLRPQSSSASAEDLVLARRGTTQYASRHGRDDELVIDWIDDRSNNRVTRGGWVIGYGLGGSASANGPAMGIDYAVGGTQFGLETYLDEVTTLGLYGGYVGSQVNTQGVTQQALANSGQLGGYLKRDWSGDYYIVAGGFSFDEYDSERQVNIGPLSNTLSGNYSGWQGITYAERGKTFAFGRTELQPYGALQYIHLRQNGFAETGGPSALAVDAVDADSLRSFVGSRLSLPMVTSSGQLIIPQIRASWLHEFLDTNQVANARLGAFGGGTSFAVQGLDLGRDWALVGTGVTWQMTERLSLAGNYDLQTNSAQTFHIGSGTLNYVW
jgi:outer membrane autotransporter protein